MKLLERASELWRRTRDALAGEASSSSDDTSAWPEVEALIYSIEAKDHGREQFGVEVWYEYHSEGDHWSGSSWIPLPDMKSAEALAGSHPAGSKLRVMYCPGKPGRSVLVDYQEQDDDGF